MKEAIYKGSLNSKEVLFNQARLQLVARDVSKKLASTVSQLSVCTCSTGFHQIFPRAFKEIRVSPRSWLMQQHRLRADGSFRHKIQSAHSLPLTQVLASVFNRLLADKGLGALPISYPSVKVLHFPARPEGRQYYNVEEFIEGVYQKFNNNAGTSTGRWRRRTPSCRPSPTGRTSPRAVGIMERARGWGARP